MDNSQSSKPNQSPLKGSEAWRVGQGGDRPTSGSGGLAKALVEETVSSLARLWREVVFAVGMHYLQVLWDAV